MNRKILSLLLIMVVAVTTMTVVSAADTITVNDVEFNIPDGYAPNDALQDVPYEDGGMTGKLSALSRGDDSILIAVVDNTAGATLDNIKNSSYVDKNISGKSGVLMQKEKVTFSYLDGDKIILLVAPDEATLEKLIK